MRPTKLTTPPNPLHVRSGVRAGVTDVLPGLQTGLRAAIVAPRGTLGARG